MVKYNYWFFNWIYVLECLYFMEWIMTETRVANEYKESYDVYIGRDRSVEYV